MSSKQSLWVYVYLTNSNLKIAHAAIQNIKNNFIGKVFDHNIKTGAISYCNSVYIATKL